jgi:hypothetical protein
VASTKAPQGARSKQSKAARTEQSDKPQLVKFRDLELTLPPTVSATVAFDLAELEGGNTSAFALIRLLSSLLGKEQFAQIRQKLAQDGDTTEDLEEILTELAGEVFGAYGMTVGESQASAES